MCTIIEEEVQHRLSLVMRVLDQSDLPTRCRAPGNNKVLQEVWIFFTVDVGKA